MVLSFDCDDMNLVWRNLADLRVHPHRIRADLGLGGRSGTSGGEPFFLPESSSQGRFI